MKPFALFLSLSVLLTACGGEGTAAAGSSSQDSAKSEAASTALQPEPELTQVTPEDADGIDPVTGTYPMRSKAEIAALEKMRKDAAAAEQNYFVSTQLKQWMKDKKQTEDPDGFPVNPKLADDQFAQLNSREKWGYALFYPEMWDQICAEATVDFSLVDAIGCAFPETWEGNSASERQIQAIAGSESELNAYLAQAKTVSTGLLYFIVEAKLTQAAPHLVRIYEESETKDYLILTALTHLMHNAQYEPFLKTKMNKVLFDGWLETIPHSPDNVKFILALSRKFAEPSAQ